MTRVASFLPLIKIFAGKVPIREILQKDLHVIGTAVLVIQVIGMLPHVTGQESLLAVGKGEVCVWSFGDFEGAVRIHDKPRPSAAKLAGGGLFEKLRERVKAAEVFCDLFAEGACRFSATLGGRGSPNKNCDSNVGLRY